ncbi:MAG: ATP-binding protein [Candidatus Cloacimonetes bacterium]|nr:ATP-binding protein [Candidatus Cloacimonadota bacterium]
MKIAIASGKGGTGKTTLSTNLVHLLSQTRKIVLTDLDVEEPNSGLFIQGELKTQQEKFKMIPQWDQEKCTLCGKCQELCNFHSIIKLLNRIVVFPELCHSCYACSELCPADALPMIPQKMGELKHFVTLSFDFIESKLDIGQEQAVPLIAQTLEYVDAQFDPQTLKLFDCPPGTSCPVIEATKEADFVILITEPTPFGLHDLKLAVETMREIGKEFAVVINRYGIGNSDVELYCNEENIEIISRLPNDRRIAELYSEGNHVYKEIPEFEKELRKIVNFIDHLQKGSH